VLRRAKPDLLVLAAYTGISFAYFGWRLASHPGRSIAGLGHDPQVFIWSFAWWAHAIGHLSNPFVTHALYAPTGVNIAWTPSAPGLALVFSPLTWLVGPVAAFNIAAVLMPALSAWTAYRLCLHVSSSRWASLAGGYLFGFSSYVFAQQLLGHVYLTGVFVLPLLALAVLRFLEGGIDRRGLAWRVGALVGAELWLSTELALTMTVALVLGLALAALFVSAVRLQVRAAVVPLAAGYGLAALLAAPLLVYALLGFRGTRLISNPIGAFGTDLVNFVVPDGIIWAGGSWFRTFLEPFISGYSAYIGLPTLVIVVLYAVRERRSPGGRFAVAAFLVSAVLALGTALHVDGHRAFGLPWWRAAEALPAFNDVIPFRLAVYVSLSAAVIVALWAARARRPYLLTGLAVFALVPVFWRSAYPSFAPSRPDRVAFFSQGLYKSCVRPGETVAILPFDNSMLWQAEAGFRFRVAADGLQPFPKYGKPASSFDNDRVVWELTFEPDGRPTMDRLLAFAALHHVDRVVSVVAGGYPDADQMRRFGPTERIGGVLVAPACGQPSLETHNLARFVASYDAESARSLPNVGWCVGLNFNLLPQGLVPAGPLAGARRAIYVTGQGITCAAPPAGYKHHGFASTDLGVPANTYALYAP
jgi:hypothetical protein